MNIYLIAIVIKRKDVFKQKKHKMSITIQDLGGEWLIVHLHSNEIEQIC